MKKIISLIVCASVAVTAATCLIVKQANKLKETAIEAKPTVIEYSSENIYDVCTVEFPDGYRAVIENDNFALGYRVNDASAALLNKATGQIWYTNPQDSDANKKSKAQLEFYYYYNNTTLNSMDSYEYCIEIDAVPRYEVEGNRLTVNYELGKNTFEIAMLPAVVKKERFENEFLSKLSAEEKQEVLSIYTLLERDNIDKDTYDLMVINYPSLKNSDIYVRSDVPNYIAEKSYNYLVKAGYTTEDLQFDCDDNGVENTYVEKPFFNASLKYYLTDYGFAVSLDPKSIEYNENYVPTKVAILPYFGAATSSDNGFLLLPDGSGAVIELNNGKTVENVYNKSFFTTDSVLNITQGETVSQLSLLPYYGISTQNGGFIASIDSGYDVGGVTAQIAGKNSPYNAVSAYFNICIASKVNYSVNENDTYYRFAENIYSDNINISYHFADESPSYSTLAVIYREHLKESGQLKISDKQDSSMNVTFKGVAQTTENFLGVNYTAYKPYTTTKEATEILKELGIKNIDVRLDNFVAGGEIQKSVSSMKLQSSAGNLKDLEDLYALTGDTFVSMRLQHIDKTSKEYAAMAISQEAAYGLEFNTASLKKELLRYSVIVSPKYLGSASSKISKQAEKKGVTAINIEDIGYSINSDLAEGEEIDRYYSRTAAQNALKTLSEKAILSVNKGSIYSLCYADKIWDIPMDSSNYAIEDYSVPFYQIVLSGSIPYTTPEINDSSDMKTQFLKAVEYGAEPQFTLTYRTLSNVDHYKDDYYSYYYKDYVDAVKEYAASYAEVCAKTDGASIINHKNENGMAVTEYDNGVKIYVNYGQTAINADGNTVNAQDFLIVE